MTMAVDTAAESELEREHYRMAGQQHRDLVTRLYEGLKLLYRGRDDRLVMSEVITYAPDGRATIPDVSVVFGPPQQDHRSYRVGASGPAPAVVLEVVSPNDTDDVNGDKLDAHLALGTQELWFLHLRTGGVERFVTSAGRFVPAAAPRCDALEGVSFEVRAGVLEPCYSDGTPFPQGASAEAARAAAEAARARRLADQLRAAGIEPEA